MELHYAIALFVSAIISTTVAMIAWQRRTAVGARSLFILMSAAAAWSLTYAIRWIAHEETAQLFWLDATYFGVVVAPTAFLILALEYTNQIHILSSRVRFGLAIIPTLTILILWTDSWHGLFYNGLRTGDAILNGGVWFWIFIAYTYIILLLASILIFRKTIQDQLFFQVQAGLLLTGMVLPWLGNIISMLGFSPFPGLDMTPFLFTASGILFMFALFRFGFLDIVPIAHSRLMEELLDGVIVLDKANRIVDFNPAAQKIFGLTSTVIGQPIQQAGLQVPKLAVLDHHINAEKSEIQIKNDNIHEFEMRTLSLLNKNNQPTGKLITLHDISEYRHAQEQIRRSEEQYRLLFENAVESIIVVRNRIIMFCNPITCELTGYPMDELINESFVKFIYPDDLEAVLEISRNRISGIKLNDRYQFRLLRKDLSFRWVETNGILIDWEGEVATLHFLMDITERKKAEISLEFRSTHDVLTGLFNRQYFEQEIERLQSSNKYPVSILVMDMNDLKEINDTLGHAAGDEQLRLAAQVIRKAFRPEDIIARIGGDEFVVLLPETDTITAHKAVERIIKVLENFNHLNPDKNLVSFAIGFATSESTPNLRDVFRIADRKMYINKEIYHAEK